LYVIDIFLIIWSFVIKTSQLSVIEMFVMTPHRYYTNSLGKNKNHKITYLITLYTILIKHGFCIIIIIIIIIIMVIFSLFTLMEKIIQEIREFKTHIKFLYGNCCCCCVCLSLSLATRISIYIYTMHNACPSSV